MKVSFLVTYYQQERFVRESMESILAIEKPFDWEILIGDDGSTDGTTDIVRTYVEKDPEHIRLYIMDRDPGEKYMPVERASLNRLNLLEHATGDCYCLLDGDDFYSDTRFVSEAVFLLESHPEVSIVGFDTWNWREGEARIKKQKQKTDPLRMNKKKYLHWQYTSAGACVIRKNNNAEETERLLKIRSFDDNDIVLNALAGGEMIRIHRPVYAYRQEDSSVYHTMNPAERAALNVSDLGAALQIMGPEWEKDLHFRYTTAIWMAWFLRKKLQEMLSPEHYDYYLDSCRRTGFLSGEQLMRYPGLSPAEQRVIRGWVYRTGLCNPLRVIYAWTQTRKWRG